eukprot:9405719-Pyramimonas_sp.AAC.1
MARRGDRCPLAPRMRGCVPVWLVGLLALPGLHTHRNVADLTLEHPSEELPVVGTLGRSRP